MAQARSGAEGLALAEFVSAVVLDLNLPDVHGLEVCRLLKKMKAGVDFKQLTELLDRLIIADPTDEQTGSSVTGSGQAAASKRPSEPDRRPDAS